MSLLICTPIRSSEYGAADVKLGYHDALRRLSTTMQVEEFGGSTAFGCDVVRARNRMAAIVLRELKYVTNVLWWDDDLWPTDISIVQKMIDAKRDVVAAPYTNKQQPLRWIHEPIPDEKCDDAGFMRVRSVGFGFTITSRRCLEKLSEESERSRESRPYWDEWGGGHRIANIFGLMYETMAHGHEGLRSEDYSFCRRWRDVGGDIWLYGGKGNILQHAGGHAWDATQMKGVELL